MVEEVKKLCYLGDILDFKDGVERAEKMRVSVAWYKWRVISTETILTSCAEGCCGIKLM